ncbi:MAG: FtsW/RodA/SpoVE family cell cycle protein [Microscillaceae bacterium]
MNLDTHEPVENRPLHEKSMPNTAFPSFEKYLKGDPYIWGIIITLALMSILVVYSATGTLAYQKMDGNTRHYLFKHTVTVLLALLAVWICHRIDYRYFSRLSRLALLASVPLLLGAWKFGVNVNEASRWITVPLIGGTFQPSDLAKLALITSIASMLSRRQDSVNDFQETVFPILLWTGIICTLIGLSDISSAVLLFITSMLLLFIGRVPVSQLLLLVLVGFISLMVAIFAGQRGDTFNSRLEKFFDETETEFQAQQSYIAIATGGFTGKLPGNSDQRNFLPNPFSDFIYAIIIEEYGLLGGLAVLGLYLLLIYRGIVVIAGSSRAYGGILSAGLTFSIGLQALLNMAVAVGLVPITGVPLPFLSMGGTSLLFTGIALGIILSVSRGDIDKDLDELASRPANRSRGE